MQIVTILKITNYHFKHCVANYFQFATQILWFPVKPGMGTKA